MKDFGKMANSTAKEVTPAKPCSTKAAGKRTSSTASAKPSGKTAASTKATTSMERNKEKEPIHIPTARSTSASGCRECNTATGKSTTQMAA